MLLISSFSLAESEDNFYQITYSTMQNDSYLYICINDECQKASSIKQVQDHYFYDFGTFPISTDEKIELKIYKYNTGKKRIKRAPEYIPKECNINSCGSFSFVKVNGPATSTTDKCKLGLAICHKVRNY